MKYMSNSARIQRSAVGASKDEVSILEHRAQQWRFVPACSLYSRSRSVRDGDSLTCLRLFRVFGGLIIYLLFIGL